MSKSFGIKISQPGKDVLSAVPRELSYTSKFEAFKPYKIVEMSSATSEPHGLSYPPVFSVMYEKISGGYTYGAPGSYASNEALASVDETNVYSHTTKHIFVVLYSNSLEDTEVNNVEDHAMDNVGIKMSPDNKNVYSSSLNNLSITTGNDSLKIYKTGTATINLVANTVAAESSEVRDFLIYTHNLGYVPLFLPQASDILGGNPGLTMDFEWVTVDEVLNEYSGISNPSAAGPSIFHELLTVYATDTELRLSVEQINNFGDPFVWDEYNITVYYTIFYNRADAEFDLLQA